MPVTARLSPSSGITILARASREYIVGTGGRRDSYGRHNHRGDWRRDLDTASQHRGSATDYDGTFNQQFLEAATGDFWGVMALTLDPNGYKWDYESALELPGDPAGPFSDKGFGACHG